MTEPYQFQITLDSDHPKLPALLEAAKELPNVELQSEDGVWTAHKRLVAAERIVHFFEVLESIIGPEETARVVYGLGAGHVPRNRLQFEGPESVMKLAQGLVGSNLIQGLVGLAARS